MKYADVPIIMYHDVGEYDTPWCVSPLEFQKQMRFLKEQGYTAISLTELQEGIKQGGERDKAVVITFDDARQGVFRFALPLLEQVGFRATVFVAPAFIEGKIPPEENYSSFLTIDTLKVLLRKGWQLESHSYAHQNLSALPLAEALYDVRQAEEWLKEKLRIKAQHFCYPYGTYTEELRLAIRQQYLTAVCTRKGFDKLPGAYARQMVLRETSVEQFQKMLFPPTLSVCMIVKNEEKFLESCLRSVQGLADEIIIVDTGSTDRTKEIALQFTSTVYDFTWCDDFAVARNESLKYATGDWILVLDADEELAPADHQFIGEALQEWSIAGYHIMTRNYSNDTSISGWKPVQDAYSRGFQGFFPSLKVRLFQRQPGVMFQGAIHELVEEKALLQYGKIVSLPMVVHHYGAQNLKSGRMGLTQHKIEAEPENAQAYFELGVQQKNLGQYGEAEVSFLRSLELEVSAVRLLNLAIVQQKQGKVSEAVQAYQRALESNKAMAEAYFGLGFCFYQQKELEKAAGFFEQAISYNPQYVDAYVNLGAVREQQGHSRTAAEYVRKALQLAPRHSRAYYNMGVIMEKNFNLPKAIACYEKAIEYNYAKREELQERVIRLKRVLEN